MSRMRRAGARRSSARLGARGALVLAAGAAAVACGKTVPKPETDTPADFAAWQHSYVEAWCAKGDRCGSVRGQRYFSPAACTESQSFAADYDRYFTGGDLYGDRAAIYRLAEPSVRDACLAAIATSPCEDDNTPKECRSVLVLAHPLREGEPCGASISGGHFGPVTVDECGPGLVCDSGPCPRCVKEPAPPPTAAANEPCTVELACAENLTCTDADGPTRLCRAPDPLPKKGEACSFNCSAGFQCNNGRCVQPAGPGEDCAPGNHPFSCMSGDLHCDDVGSGKGVCRPYARVGQPCDRFASERPEAGSKACLRGLWCVFDTPDAPTGICGGAPVLSGPLPCSGFGNVGDELVCPIGARRVTHDDTSRGGPTEHCLCEPLGAEGEACAAAGDCGPGLVCMSGQCRTPLSDGEACTSNDQCGSSYCNLSLGRCGSNACPDACPGVDRNTDLLNCGACGYVCAGLTVIAPSPGYVRAIDATGVYAVDPDRVLMLPLSGGDPVTLATGQFNPSSIALDQDHVYFTNFYVGVSPVRTGNVLSVPKSGGVPTVLASGQGSPSGLVVANSGVYWLNGDDDKVLHLFPIGTTFPLLDAATFSTGIAAFTVDATKSYVVVKGSTGSSPSDSVVSMKRPLGAPVTLASGLPAVSDIAVDAVAVYWATDTTIQSVSLDGGTPVTLATGLSAPGGLIVHDATLYFSASDGVWSLPAQGGKPRHLIAPTSGSFAILTAVDGSSLYWTNPDKLLSAPLTGIACRNGVCQ